MAKPRLIFRQFQMVPATEWWHAELFGLDDEGQIWVQDVTGVNREARKWQKVSQVIEEDASV